MSRHGYSDDGDYDQWASIRWRGQVASAFRGARGQAFLREAIQALEDLPEKKLAPGSFAEASDGQPNFCTLGAVGRKRGLDMSHLQAMAEDEDDTSADAGAAFGIARAMAAEIMFYNDEYGPHNETDEQRWHRMHRWLSRQLIEWENANPGALSHAAGASESEPVK
jgi:hypothetical protein